MTRYHHVDVFAGAAYTGNSLAVVVDPPELDTTQMTRITQEFRHFETIFVRTSAGSDAVSARVFDLAGELDFAGHPVLGAAAVLHELGDARQERRWSFSLNARTVAVTTRRRATGHLSALMDQGRPEWIRASATPDRASVAAAMGLAEVDLDPTLPLEVVSTGLRYLVVPVRGDALGRARITRPDLTAYLAGFGAEFVYLLDAARVEGRHWNNDGLLEDVATGSAAGCVAAYLARHGRTSSGEQVPLAQGRFAGRPSTILVTAHGSGDVIERVTVGGEVTLVATGALRVLPATEQA